MEYFQAQEKKMKLKVKSMKDRFTEMKHEIQKEMVQFMIIRSDRNIENNIEITIIMYIN